MIMASLEFFYEFPPFDNSVTCTLKFEPLQHWLLICIEKSFDYLNLIDNYVWIVYYLYKYRSVTDLTVVFILRPLTLFCTLFSSSFTSLKNNLFVVVNPIGLLVQSHFRNGGQFLASNNPDNLCVIVVFNDNSNSLSASSILVMLYLIDDD
jgi:hypothetical protein